MALGPEVPRLPLLLCVLLGLAPGCAERIQHGADGGDRGGVDPGACGGRPFPDGTVTGYSPTGVQLTPYEGPTHVTSAGTVIEGADISACLIIDAPEVVVKRSRIRSAGRCGLGLVDVRDSAVGTAFEDVEIDGLGAGGFGIIGGGYTASRMDIHGLNGGIAISGRGPTVLEDSWVHDLVRGGPTEVDSVSSNGASRVVLRNNNLENPFNSDAVIGLFGDFAPISDFLVERNLLNGGGYTVYAGHHPSKDFPNTSDIRFQNNCFGRAYFTQSGYFGPVSAFEPDGPGNVWSANRWYDSGSEVRP